MAAKAGAALCSRVTAPPVSSAPITPPRRTSPQYPRQSYDRLLLVHSTEPDSTRLIGPDMRPRSASEHYALAPRPRHQPAGRWLCATLRADIRTGRLAPGARL